MPTATSSNQTGRWSKLFSKKQAPSAEEQQSAKEIAQLDDAQVNDGDAAESNITKDKKRETAAAAVDGTEAQGGDVEDQEVEPARQSKDQDDGEDEEIFSGRILFFNK